jgi:hypothetical protein
MYQEHQASSALNRYYRTHETLAKHADSECSFVAAVAEKYANPSRHLAEMEQEARANLTRAVEAQHHRAALEGFRAQVPMLLHQEARPGMVSGDMVPLGMDAGMVRIASAIGADLALMEKDALATGALAATAAKALQGAAKPAVSAAQAGAKAMLRPANSLSAVASRVMGPGVAKVPSVVGKAGTGAVSAALPQTASNVAAAAPRGNLATVIAPSKAVPRVQEAVAKATTPAPAATAVNNGQTSAALPTSRALAAPAQGQLARSSPSAPTAVTATRNAPTSAPASMALARATPTAMVSPTVSSNAQAAIPSAAPGPNVARASTARAGLRDGAVVTPQGARVGAAPSGQLAAGGIGTARPGQSMSASAPGVQGRAAVNAQDADVMSRMEHNRRVGNQAAASTGSGIVEGAQDAAKKPWHRGWKAGLGVLGAGYLGYKALKGAGRLMSGESSEPAIYGNGGGPAMELNRYGEV